MRSILGIGEKVLREIFCRERDAAQPFRKERSGERLLSIVPATGAMHVSASEGYARGTVLQNRRKRPHQGVARCGVQELDVSGLAWERKRSRQDDLTRIGRGPTVADEKFDSPKVAAGRV